eukprot:476150-Hanusia_phi.AAC.3
MHTVVEQAAELSLLCRVLRLSVTAELQPGSSNGIRSFQIGPCHAAGRGPSLRRVSEGRAQSQRLRVG